MPSKQREHLLVAVVLICVGALAADSLLITPLMKLWSTRAQAITDLQRKVTNGGMLVGREEVLEERWSEMREQGHSTDDSVIENDMLKSVSHWAVASSLTVTSLKPRPISEDDCKKLELRVAAIGSLAAIARFLYELEIDQQAIKVEDLALASRDEKGQTLTCDVRLTRLVLDDTRKDAKP